jgi:hypothetical protein
MIIIRTIHAPAKPEQLGQDFNPIFETVKEAYSSLWELLGTKKIKITSRIYREGDIYKPLTFYQTY